ncbi:conserved exported hypothetical protein [Methylocella tundrae]|uniref:Uncharacterized protein n=1 Tax=Methylocella tundrae TaxID=227605 RepID=A0A8B6MAX6_METTU|nr:hypothetical protein [Methylocella tundrae]VTZ24540.1 conserved exported hypothetical protein [Methylocella tundrae]VTZ52143.1 conserved exported hypothetical protein [Methylocella tundrae]
MLRSTLVFIAGAAGFMAAMSSGRAAETCFHVCLKEKMTAPDIDDQGIRDLMSDCRDVCAERAEARLIEAGLGDKIKGCAPQPVDDADLKKIRSASPSVVAFANAFTWDVNNVLPGKIIRRVEIGTQSLSLQDVTLTASGIVEPGESGTFFMNNVADGYPSLRVTSRIKAIYACPVD